VGPKDIIENKYYLEMTPEKLTIPIASSCSGQVWCRLLFWESHQLLCRQSVK